MADSVKKPRIFIDSDVLFAGAASPNQHSASLVVLRMAEITLVDAFASQQVLTEVERNLQAKLPVALPVFQTLVSRCLKIVADPVGAEIDALTGVVHQGDAPILAAAIREECPFLATYNVRHYQPGVPTVTALAPGDLVQRIRFILAKL